MFKPLPRDSWLAIGLFLALAVVMFITYARQQAERLPPLASFSNQPDGARALWLWLQELGYTVNNAAPSVYAPPAAVDLLLILEPTEFINDQAWAELDAWVEAGGTLLVAGDRYLLTSWADHFDLRRDDWQTGLLTTTLRLQHPLLASPPLAQHPGVLPDVGTLQTDRDDLVVHAATVAGPVMVSFAQGQGQVILSTTSYPLTNQGLREPGMADLALNLVSLAGEPGRVWFDEWHHGVRAESTTDAPVGIHNWLRATVPGRALLLAMGIVFVALLLRGRSFGRPLPLPQQLVRRNPLEYVTAIANLQRRAGHRAALLQDYHLRLKRELGRRYRLDVKLPDAEFVNQLAVYQPTLDRAALQQLLDRLHRGNGNEAQVVQLAAEATKWIEK